ncbi:MAG TPA: C4-type zinc ribbon domain-containing protein [Geopsychrobacteraceae bacterium]|nr:C4-type zinc ribbon domain-containing protein [Geopsychrobacteraceae bacterium]
MHEKMNLLRELQEIDQEVSALEMTRQGYLEELSAFDIEISRIQSMSDELNAELEGLRAEDAQLQQELIKEQDNISKVEARLPGIQTQKEYVAVLKEIDLAKKANKEIEDRVLAKQQEIETLEGDLKEKTDELTAAIGKADARRSELDKLLAESDKGLQDKQSVRASVASDVPSSLLRKYQTLFKRRAGLAVAMARNGACLGCNMQLPPQQFNSLYRQTELQSCPHCNRLLYIEAEV